MTTVAVGDINGDSDLDLAVVDSTVQAHPGNVSVVLGEPLAEASAPGRF